MTIQYTWKVVQLEAIPTFNNETNVVKIVHWTLTGTDGTFSGSTYGSSSVQNVDTAGPFIPYEQLTEEEVIIWVKAAIGADMATSYEALVAEQIDVQVNPPIVKPPLPW